MTTLFRPVRMLVSIDDRNMIDMLGLQYTCTPVQTISLQVNFVQACTLNPPSILTFACQLQASSKMALVGAACAAHESQACNIVQALLTKTAVRSTPDMRPVGSLSPSVCVPDSQMLRGPCLAASLPHAVGLIPSQFPSKQQACC
jgi:hypothetical protein